METQRILGGGPRGLLLLAGLISFLQVTTSTRAQQAPTDTDGDGWPDADEIALGTNPNDPKSFPKPGEWAAEMTKSKPNYWYRFEETSVASPAQNQGSTAGFSGVYGSGISNSDLGKTSAGPGLGKALEFTGPQAGSDTQKFVDFSAEIPELVDFRDAPEEKTTAVEYWIKTTQKGSNGDQTWTNPALLGRESPGDGDMYWGFLIDTGDFGFSTSDIRELYANRDGGLRVSNGQWHHIVMVKAWHLDQPCQSIMYVDGGVRQGGATIIRETPAGIPSLQDLDGGIQFLGFTQNGGGPDVQFIGTIDELAIYNRPLSEAEVRLHFLSVVPDTDNDGMPDAYELAHGLNPNLNDASEDSDGDGLANIDEFRIGTDPKNPDTDGDGLSDGIETNTGIWVSAKNTGTNPLNSDSDGDGLKDGVETNTGVWTSVSNTGTNPLRADTDGDGLSDTVETNTGKFVSLTNTGTSPGKTDTDNDGIDDSAEIALGTDPNSALSFPKPAKWPDEVAKSKPKYWYRFEQTDPAQGVPNEGSVAGFKGAFGPDISAADLGKPSAAGVLGKALEFTGPEADNTTGKFVDFGAVIPELTDFRNAPKDKTTTVEYWIKTSQAGTHGDNTWESPSILARESPGDGDMYWGFFNANGDFGFSTSDIREIFSQRDGRFNVTDNNWHHVVLVKEWHVTAACRSTMYLDGGGKIKGGVTITRTTAGGSPSLQDADSGIQFLGFTQNGGAENSQFIGLIDELLIYDRALSESEVKLHFLSADTDGDGMPDAYEARHGLNATLDDANLDPDNDGLTNLQEFLLGADPQNADTDGDGLKDGVETNTGVWVSATNTGTDPLNPDTDGDGLLDGAETNNGQFLNRNSTGSNPLKADTDADTFKDSDEVVLGTNPNDPTSKPQIPPDFVAALRNDKPAYWWRFEGTDLASGVRNEGSVAGFNGTYLRITADELGKPSAFPTLGKAFEFTGPRSAAANAKAIDFGAPIPELTNFRDTPEDGKITTVEYWIKTSSRGNAANQTWNSPAIFARESPGDGDMYWGWFNATGQFGFSTSDMTEIFANRVVDTNWHHIMLVKEWNLEKPCVSTMYVDGGALIGGQTLQATTPAGAPSLQDTDGAIQFLGFTENGGAANVQYIGLIDEVAIYNKRLTEGQAHQHFMAAGGKPPSQPFSITGVTFAQQTRTLTLTWSSSPGQKFALQRSDNLTTPNWTTVTQVDASSGTSTTASDTIPAASKTAFYRVLEL